VIVITSLFGEGSGEPTGSSVSENREAKSRPPETEGFWRASPKRPAWGGERWSEAPERASD